MKNNVIEKINQYSPVVKKKELLHAVLVSSVSLSPPFCLLPLLSN